MVVSQFADGIAIYCNRGSLDSYKRLVTRAIDVISSNLEKLGLELSPHKTVLIYFNRKGVEPGNVAVKVRDVEIVSSESVKFLGITYDYRLDFSKHVQEVQKKCSRAMNIISFVR